MKRRNGKKKKTYPIMLFGQTYELPITRETAPFIALLKGNLKPWASTKGLRDWSRKSFAEKGMREIIRVLLHQVRDSIGADVTRTILQELSDRLDPMVNQRVEADMQRGLPKPTKQIEGK